MQTRNMDLIKKIMAYLEANLEGDNFILASNIAISGYTKSEIMSNSRLLADTDYVEVTKIYNVADGWDTTFYRITWHGFDFLHGGYSTVHNS